MGYLVQGWATARPWAPATSSGRMLSMNPELGFLHSVFQTGKLLVKYVQELRSTNILFSSCNVWFGQSSVWFCFGFRPPFII